MRHALRRSIGVILVFLVLGFTPIPSYAQLDTTIESFPTNPSNSASASFSFTSMEEQTAFECRLDGSVFSDCESPKSYSGLSEGSHTFEVRATIDQGNNVDPTPASYSWTVDTTSPETTIGSGPTNPTINTSANFTFSSNETGSTFECRLDGDGGGFEVCTSPKSYSGLSEGSHTFEVRAIDQGNNVDPTPASFSWTIDAVAPYTTLNGDWMVNIRGPNNDKGAAHITFNGPKISGYGFLFSLGQVFFIEEGSQVTIDYPNRKIEGSFNLVTSGTSPTKLGKITIFKGTFNKKLAKLTLTPEFDKEGVIPPIRITYSGYRFDPTDQDLLEVPEEFTSKAKIKGNDVGGRPITVILEPSSLGDRLGILSGGGYCKYNELPFELTISDSIFFITDKGQIYGEFNSNLFSTMMTGKVVPTARGPKFLFKPLLTFYAARAAIQGIAEETLPVPTTLVSPENNATGVPINPTTFTWTASEEGVTYGLQVSTSSGFNTTVVNETGLTGTSKPVSGLLNNKLYYWRMNATKLGVTSDWSPTPNWKFTTVVAIPPAPVLTSPLNNATGVPTNPTLSWNASSGATSYLVQVATDSGFSNIAFQGGITSTSQPVSGLLNNTLYYWRVNATNAAGTSGWSTVFDFTTVAAP